MEEKPIYKDGYARNCLTRNLTATAATFQKQIINKNLRSSAYKSLFNDSTNIYSNVIELVFVCLECTLICCSR